MHREDCVLLRLLCHFWFRPWNCFFLLALDNDLRGINDDLSLRMRRLLGERSNFFFLDVVGGDEEAVSNVAFAWMMQEPFCHDLDPFYGLFLFDSWRLLTEVVTLNLLTLSETTTNYGLEICEHWSLLFQIFLALLGAVLTLVIFHNWWLFNTDRAAGACCGKVQSLLPDDDGLAVFVCVTSTGCVAVRRKMLTSH